MESLSVFRMLFDLYNFSTSRSVVTMALFYCILLLWTCNFHMKLTDFVQDNIKRITGSEQNRMWEGDWIFLWELFTKNDLE